MGVSVWQILIILLIVVLLFGAGRLPRVMSDMAKGIKSFKSGLKDDDDLSEADPPRQVAADGTRDGKPAASRDRTVEH